jgi:hypothetical protein
MAGRIHGKTKNRTSYQYRENIRIDILAWKVKLQREPRGFKIKIKNFPAVSRVLYGIFLIK